MHFFQQVLNIVKTEHTFIDGSGNVLLLNHNFLS